MVPGLTLGILSACVLTRRSTIVVVTSSIQRTFTVVDTLASRTADERISSKSSGTCAHRTIRSGSIEASLAGGSRTTGVWVTQITLLELPTAHERISSEATRTRTHSLVVGGLTISAMATNVRVGFLTWVTTLQSDASLVGGAITVSGAFGVTTREGITEEVRRTGALRSVVDCPTVCILSTSSASARGLTSIRLTVTSLRLSTFSVGITLVSTALQRVPDVCLLASTHWSVVLANLAICVSPARSADFFSGEPSAITERISGGSSRTPTDGNVILHSAVSSLATGDGAGINTLVVLAGALWATVGVLVTFSLNTAGVGIALMTGKTLAHRPSSYILTLSTSTTDTIYTRVCTATRPAVRTA